jgi:hypothetical protein
MTGTEFVTYSTPLPEIFIPLPSLRSLRPLRETKKHQQNLTDLPHYLKII